MNLYRLDFLNPDGTVAEAVTGAHVGWVLSSDVLVRSYALARSTAKVAATRHTRPIGITRISGGGHMKRTATVNAEGRVSNGRAIPDPYMVGRAIVGWD